MVESELMRILISAVEGGKSLLERLLWFLVRSASGLSLHLSLLFFMIRFLWLLRCRGERLARRGLEVHDLRP